MLLFRTWGGIPFYPYYNNIVKKRIIANRQVKIKMKLCIFLVILLAYGCTRRETVPYDDRRCQALLDACEAILADDAGAALEALQVMEELGGDDFAAETRLALQRRQDFDKAEELLRQRDYQGLRLFLAQAKASGRVGEELEGFDELPDALEQLELFRSRMPWESARVLKDSLEDLEPHLGLLSKSPAFEAFYQSQLATLTALREKEAEARARQCLERMEKALLAGAARAFEEPRQLLKADQPDHFYFQVEGELLKGTLPAIKKGQETAFAVALVSNWGKIKKGTRSKAVSSLNRQRAGAGICGIYANALQSGALKDYEALICAARDARVGISGGIVRTYMGKLALSEHPARLSPWPGPFEAVEAIAKDVPTAGGM